MMSQNDKNNSDFKIQNILSSEKDLSESKEQSTNFTIQNNTGEIVSINVNRKETVENLQTIIQNQCGIPLNKQILSCFGESTLLNGNNGMKQTVTDLNEIRVNVNEMKDDLENKYDEAQRKNDELSKQISKLTKTIAELIAQSPICRIKDLEDKYDKAQQRIDELEAKIAEHETKNNQINFEVDDESNGQNVEQKDLAQVSKTGVCQISNQITKLTKENAELIDPSRICKIKDLCCDDDDEDDIDYELLNGKILEIDELKYLDYKRKWFADEIKISFEYSDFLVYPKELRVYEHSNLSTSILNRIVCNNLKSLFLRDTTVTYSDYKKLTTSQKLFKLNLYFVTVMDENGKKVEIDKLLKETKNVYSLHYWFNDGKVTSETAQKLAELPPFPNLRTVYLQNVQECFDLKTFAEFLQKNSTIFCCALWFKCSDKFYKEIKRAQNDLLSILPSTCKLVVYKM